MPEEEKVKAKALVLNPDPNASEKVNLAKLEYESVIYRWVILFIGVSVLLVIIAVSILVGLGKTPPDGLIAIGSAAVGAMAGILAPSPVTTK